MPRATVLSATIGTALGLWADAQAGGVATLAALCLGGPRDLAGMLALHWDLLPGMHLGMIAGVLAPCSLERRRPTWAMIAGGLFCLAWMAAGMAVGTLAFASMAGSAAGPAGMLFAMLAGMAGGMAAATAIARLATVQADRLRLGWRG